MSGELKKVSVVYSRILRVYSSSTGCAASRPGLSAMVALGCANSGIARSAGRKSLRIGGMVAKGESSGIPLFALTVEGLPSPFWGDWIYSGELRDATTGVRSGVCKAGEPTARPTARNDGGRSRHTPIPGRIFVHQGHAPLVAPKRLRPVPRSTGGSGLDELGGIFGARDATARNHQRPVQGYAAESPLGAIPTGAPSRAARAAGLRADRGPRPSKLEPSRDGVAGDDASNPGPQRSQYRQDDQGGNKCTVLTDYSMADLVQWLQVIVPMANGDSFGPGSRPRVIDKTDLSGTFDFRLCFHFQPVVPRAGQPSEQADNPDDSSLFAALQNDLGLKLERSKSRLDVLVIDRAERVPAAN